MSLKKKSESQDIGFGNKAGKQTARLIQSDGTFNVKRVGMVSKNFYMTFVEMSWIKFYVLILSFYLTINFIFAGIFTSLGPGAIFGVDEISNIDRYIHCYFFSIQTFTTVGYGAMHPVSMSANILASLVAFSGLMVIAIITGLLFARLSKPKAFIKFSDNIIITPYKEGKAIMFRLANIRDSIISEVKILVMLNWVINAGEDERREYHTLTLERDSVALFPLNWTIVHDINETSPLQDISLKILKDRNAEIMVDLKAYDETFNQMVRIRHSYLLSELIESMKFDMMYHTNEVGEIVLELHKINELVPVGDVEV